MIHTHKHGLAVTAALALLAVLAAAPPVSAQPGITYRITVTNITNSQILSPPIAVAHRLGSGIFKPGQQASAELAAVAEDADAAGLLAALAADPGVMSFATGAGPLPPGASATLELTARTPFSRLSVVGMLVTTNDAFFGVDSFPISGRPWVKEVFAPAYDAGSEANNELCAFIPGPPCGSPGVRDTAGAEGFIHVHPGIRGVGDLDPDVWDWKNPVARVTIVEVR